MFKKINKKGFTLAELLIVVAIIGVLVAISIPIFTMQLKKAHLATNQANARAAYAATVAGLLDKEYTAGTGVYTVDTAKCSVDGESGTYAATGTTAIPPQAWIISGSAGTSKWLNTSLGSKTYGTWTVSIGSDGKVMYSGS